MLACSLLRSLRHWHLTLLQLGHFRISTWGFPGGGRAEEPGSAGDGRDAGCILGAGRSPGGEHDNPPQYSCLENLMNRGTWWATVHGVTEHRTQLSDLAHMHGSLRTLKSASRKPQTLAFIFFFH